MTANTTAWKQVSPTSNPMTAEKFPVAVAFGMYLLPFKIYVQQPLRHNCRLPFKLKAICFT